jgi:nucleoside-diphosphate-sugar epimerase
MRVLVTGHNGYIGSVTMPALRAAGHEVSGLDTFFFEGCTIGLDGSYVPALRRDIRDVTVQDLEGFDAVIHLAALSGDPVDTESAERIEAINHTAAVRLARCAREAGVGLFLFASTCGVYGPGSGDGTVAEDAAVKPITAYATSKARAEAGILSLAQAGFSPVVLRAATAYGVSPRLRVDIELNELVRSAHMTGRIRVTGDGLSWRAMIHVRDVAQAFTSALTAPREGLHARVLNVGANGENYQLVELAEIVRAAVPGSVIDRAAGVDTAGRSYRVDFSRLARAIPAFRPQWNAVFGAKDLYAALQEAEVTPEGLQGHKYVRLAQLKFLLTSGLVDEHLRWVPTALSGAGS